MRHVALTVNGVGHELEVEPRELLVYFLRDRLRPDRDERRLRHVVVRRLHRARRRRVGEVVHDARASRPTAPRSRRSRASPTDGELHPVQQAFHEHHALQCGYCTPGMVMAAVSSSTRTPSRPSEAEVREGLEGNLCRCTGYHNIVKAVLAAAGGGGVMSATEEPDGVRRPRVKRREEDAALLTGRGRVRRRPGDPPGTVHMIVVRSPYAHAKDQRRSTSRRREAGRRRRRLHRRRPRATTGRRRCRAPGRSPRT